jgi:hypothetical protein
MQWQPTCCAHSRIERATATTATSGSTNRTKAVAVQYGCSSRKLLIHPRTNSHIECSHVTSQLCHIANIHSFISDHAKYFPPDADAR